MKKNITIVMLFVLIFSSVLPIGIQTSIAQTQPDPSLYDEEGFLIKQPNISQDISSENTVESEKLAQTQTFSISPTDVKVGELASCFDYYKFGSVDINLTTDFSSYESGNPILITGRITNSNPYPLVGLDIKARLVKDIPSPQSMRAEILILDECDVADNIALDANGTFTVSYSHLLPLNAPSGQYQLLFYAVEQDRFNMSGLSFTNDIVGSSVKFDVEGNISDHVYLDQTQIVVGDQPHNVMAFMTQHTPGTPVPVTIPLYNPSSEPIEMRVVYDLYSWDAALDSNRLSSKTEIVEVPAMSEYELTYVVQDTSLPVYYLSISAEPTSQELDQSVLRQKTISNIRLVIQGQSKSRLNYVGVNTYPLVKGEEAVLVTCFHNTSNEINKDITRIETVILDSKNKEISRIEYVGQTIPAISGLINKFIPSRNTSVFTISSTMYDAQNNVIDSVSKKYDCKDIDPESCPVTEPLSTLMIIVIIGIIIGLLVLVYKRKTFNLIRV